MDQDSNNRDCLLPHLKAENEETRKALCAPEILLPCLPFRVGREARRPPTNLWTYLRGGDRRDREIPPSNDLYLPEEDGRVFISHQHFLIHRDEQGGYYVLDRGSTLGTLVGGKKIGGGKKPGKALLKSGDLIIPGGNRSPFVFRFELRPARALPVPDVSDYIPS